MVIIDYNIIQKYWHIVLRRIQSIIAQSDLPHVYMSEAVVSNGCRLYVYNDIICIYWLRAMMAQWYSLVIINMSSIGSINSLEIFYISIL